MGAQDASEASFEFDIGDLVFDRDYDQPDPAVVVNVPPKTADEWTAYSDVTVAEDNPDYPAYAPVIVVSFRHEIADKQPEMLAPDKPIPVTELNEIGISHYTFPAPRLRLADPETDDIDNSDNIDDINDIDEIDNEPVSTAEDGGTETPRSDAESTEATATEQDATVVETEETADAADEQQLQQLKGYLLDNGVRSEVDDGVVVAEKLGQRYEITLEGDVDGDGPYHDRLKQLVSDYSP